MDIQSLVLMQIHLKDGTFLWIHITQNRISTEWGNVNAITDQFLSQMSFSVGIPSGKGIFFFDAEFGGSRTDWSLTMNFCAEFLHLCQCCYNLIYRIGYKLIACCCTWQGLECASG